MYELIKVGPDKSKICTLCPDGKKIKCGSNRSPNTSNLEYHLMRWHREIAISVLTKHKESKRISLRKKLRQRYLKDALGCNKCSVTEVNKA